MTPVPQECCCLSLCRVFWWVNWLCKVENKEVNMNIIQDDSFFLLVLVVFCNSAQIYLFYWIKTLMRNTISVHICWNFNNSHMFQVQVRSTVLIFFGISQTNSFRDTTEPACFRLQKQLWPYIEWVNAQCY